MKLCVSQPSSQANIATDAIDRETACVKTPFEHELHPCTSSAVRSSSLKGSRAFALNRISTGPVSHKKEKVQYKRVSVETSMVAEVLF
ncbi:unnamed protein product [Protopolystoma xenopodis]|uniref:Uncharacterized protein n=1 Tax=Protopolystoma xenopodis TaxID=117903 RepID=A0A3S5B0A6_9PLAT|nr:unnamed protein product [Protopolystoma xenopodis]